MPISRIRTPSYIKPSTKGKQKRIRIPQPEERPLTLRKRDVVKWEEVNREPWWFTLHHRGPKREKIGEDILEARAVSKSQVNGTLPERIVYKFLVERLRLVSGIDFNFQCIAGHHKVLTKDLRWVPISELQVGDELLNITENHEFGGGRDRKWETGIVIHNKPYQSETFEVLLSNGKRIIATPEHPWLVNYNMQKGNHGGVKGPSKKATTNWVQTKDLKPGYYIPVFMKTWEEITTYEAGWIAGFFDGEGSVIHSKTKTGGHAITITAGQNAGPMFDRFVEYVAKAGFDFSIYDYRGKYKRSYDEGRREIIQLRISGGRSEALRFLGSIRPSKLANLKYDKLGKLTKIDQVSVLSITPIGIQTVYKLGVSNKTYIAEGFGMHNSSQMGGRLELGGLVADFAFPLMRMIIQVQGPTHDTFLRSRKDIEQTGDLTNMGYMVKEIDDDTIYNEYMFEEWMRRAFGLANGMGGSPGAFGSLESSQDFWALILSKTKQVYDLYFLTVGR